MPSRYPIFISLVGQPVLVVGGGAVALRKVLRLLDAGARVTLVAPVVADELRALSDAGALEWHGRAFRAGDVAGRCLVFTATGTAATDLAVVSAARAVGTLVNSADQETAGDFDLPALVDKGPLQVAVYSGGAAPGFSAVLAKEIGEQLPAHLPDYLRLLEEVRLALRERFPEEPKKRQRRFAEALEHQEARRLAEAGQLDAARAALQAAAGLAPPA